MLAFEMRQLIGILRGCRRECPRPPITGAGRASCANGGPGVWGGGARFLGAEAGRPGRVVANAPYSGEVLTEVTQTLPDGNRIHRSSSVRVYRDSEGRTRSEQSLSNLGGFAPNAKLPEVVFINDPVAGVNYALKPAAHTAMRSCVDAARIDRATAPAKGSMGGRGFRRGGSAPNLKTESLGRQTIEGIAAEGTRTTETIPAGQIGNEQAIQIVTESWYSPELQVMVLSKRSDPRAGETTTRLTGVSRAEPVRSLFELPADYKVTENGRR